MSDEAYELFKTQIAELDEDGYADFPKFRATCESFASALIKPLRPKTFEAMFNYAWRMGHSVGFEDVGITLYEVVKIAASCNPPTPFPER